jgi:holo-[acyl-carrier protein] synthase
MIKQIGIDTIEHERFIEYIGDAKRVERFLSNDEQVIFHSFGAEERKLHFLSGRFAMKEAIIKALSPQGLSFGYQDISILNDTKGIPYVVCSFSYNGKMHISLSHGKTVSVAVCIIEDV